MAAHPQPLSPRLVLDFLPACSGPPSDSAVCPATCPGATTAHSRSPECLSEDPSETCCSQDHVVAATPTESLLSILEQCQAAQNEMNGCPHLGPMPLPSHATGEPLYGLLLPAVPSLCPQAHIGTHFRAQPTYVTCLRPKSRFPSFDLDLWHVIESFLKLLDFLLYNVCICEHVYQSCY